MMNAPNAAPGFRPSLAAECQRDFALGQHLCIGRALRTGMRLGIGVLVQHDAGLHRGARQQAIAATSRNGPARAVSMPTYGRPVVHSRNLANKHALKA